MLDNCTWGHVRLRWEVWLGLKVSLMLGLGLKLQLGLVKMLRVKL